MSKVSGRRLEDEPMGCGGSRPDGSGWGEDRIQERAQAPLPVVVVFHVAASCLTKFPTASRAGEQARQGFEPFLGCRGREEVPAGLGSQRSEGRGRGNDRFAHRQGFKHLVLNSTG